MKQIDGTQYKKRMNIVALKENIDAEITLAGMLYRIRRMRGFAFLRLRMGREIVQCICTEELLQGLEEEMSVLLTATVTAEARAKEGFELHVKEVRVLSAPKENALPVVIHNKEVEASLATLLDYRSLTLRNETERNIFLLQAEICKHMRRFFEKEGFTEIHSPKLVAAGAEGGANLFSLPYFEQQAYLAQSPQFYKQMMVGVYERVYEIGPVFRAERHDTARHLNEYTSVDVEFGFLENFYEIMALETAVLKFLFAELQQTACGVLEQLKVTLPRIETIPVIRFLQAKEICKERGIMHTEKMDLSPEEEKELSLWAMEERGSEFLFITHYPSEKRPFYAMDDPKNEAETLSFDLLFRGMEITTGGQRIHAYDMQVKKMRKKGLDPAAFQDYLMAHRYGLPPHGGFGLGLERLTTLLIGAQNVRRGALFPRDCKRLTP